MAALDTDLDPWGPDPQHPWDLARAQTSAAAPRRGSTSTTQDNDGAFLRLSGIVGGGLPWDLIETDPVALASDPSGARTEYFPLIRSFHSLGFVQDRVAILASLAPDASPLLADFVRWFRPTQSFTEAHIHLQVPLYQILRVAAHLIFWGKARLIMPVCMRNVLTMHPAVDLTSLVDPASPLVAEYTRQSQSGGPPLLDFVAAVTTGPPRFLQMCIPTKELRNAYLDAAGFLVSRGVLVQLQTYVYLKIPSILVRVPGLTLADFEQLCGAEGAPALLGATAGASGSLGAPRPEQRKCVLPAHVPWHLLPQAVRDWVRLMAASFPVGHIAAVFERVAPYLNGRFHTNEICFRTGVSRKDLKSVLAAYASELITVLHE
ncbi:nitrogen permease regulator of amino acid transport activity 3-domain-containing protein [Blastocladiella britannica]|nr:nitrogen permease regulator of amino acid transport activity 3-domain-containing protein [Blastocladiella britannica]